MLAEERVSCAVLGPRTVLQLEQLVREAGDAPYLDPEVLGRVEKELGAVGVRQ